MDCDSDFDDATNVVLIGHDLVVTQKAHENLTSECGYPVALPHPLGRHAALPGYPVFPVKPHKDIHHGGIKLGPGATPDDL